MVQLRVIIKLCVIIRFLFIKLDVTLMCVGVDTNLGPISIIYNRSHFIQINYFNLILGMAVV
jgi:hypothetical protein